MGTGKRRTTIRQSVVRQKSQRHIGLPEPLAGTALDRALFMRNCGSQSVRHNCPCIVPRVIESTDKKGNWMPKIALVDDDRNILTSVSLTLEAEGYSVSTYTDGASGLEGLTTDRPDLAILDIKMPRMDGMELLRRLRQKSDVPVIFLTSKDEEIDELFGLKMGADDFITKPFSQRLLVERVQVDPPPRRAARSVGPPGAPRRTAPARR